MQIGKIDLIRPQEPVLERLRLLHPQNHLGAFVDFLRRFGRRGRIHDFSALPGIVGIFKTTGLSGAFLQQDGVPVLLHDFHPCRGHGNPILARLSFF